MTSYCIDFSPILKLTDQQFEQLCDANPEIKFERTATGELVIMPPTGGETGRRNAELTADFINWNRQARLGVVFDSSTCFRLSELGGGDRSPDVSWVEKSRWEALSEEEQQKFPPIAPDFVLELLSPSDSVQIAQKKMLEYLDAGVQLGWLIHPKQRGVYIYRQGQEMESLTRPRSLSGENVLPGFMLNLDGFWS